MLRNEDACIRAWGTFCIMWLRSNPTVHLLIDINIATAFRTYLPVLGALGHSASRHWPPHVAPTCHCYHWTLLLLQVLYRGVLWLHESAEVKPYKGPTFITSLRPPRPPVPTEQQQSALSGVSTEFRLITTRIMQTHRFRCSGSGYTGM